MKNSKTNNKINNKTNNKTEGNANNTKKACAKQNGQSAKDCK